MLYILNLCDYVINKNNFKEIDIIKCFNLYKMG